MKSGNAETPCATNMKACTGGKKGRQQLSRRRGHKVADGITSSGLRWRANAISTKTTTPSAIANRRETKTQPSPPGKTLLPETKKHNNGAHAAATAAAATTTTVSSRLTCMAKCSSCFRDGNSLLCSFSALQRV